MPRKLSTIREPPTKHQLLLRELDAKEYTPTPELALALKHHDARRRKADTKSQKTPSTDEALEKFKRENEKLDRRLEMFRRTARKRTEIEKYKMKEKQRTRKLKKKAKEQESKQPLHHEEGSYGDSDDEWEGGGKRKHITRRRCIPRKTRNKKNKYKKTRYFRWCVYA